MRTRVQVTFEIQCSMCEAKDIQTGNYQYGSQRVTQPKKPETWTELVDGVLICPDHKILLAVDGEVVVDK